MEVMAGGCQCFDVKKGWMKTENDGQRPGNIRSANLVSVCAPYIVACVDAIKYGSLLTSAPTKGDGELGGDVAESLPANS
jgi:hypothetical protein